MAFFIGNSYVLSNQPEESFAYLRDFGARFPDSLYAHDAIIAHAKALLATNRPGEAINLLEAHRVPASARAEYYLGKAYGQTARAVTGAEILRRVYYDYATSYLADEAGADLKKDSGGIAAPASHLRRPPEARRRSLQSAALSSRSGASISTSSIWRRPDSSSAG